MNILFSDLFRKFGGVFLEVCETISGAIWEIFAGQIEENYPEKNRKKSGKPYCKILFKIVYLTTGVYLFWVLTVLRQ